nr:hypothetical protein GCM10025730_02290 [Promicromonospora thailandica]
MLDPAPLAEVREILGALTARRAPVSVANLDALGTEVRRAARDRRRGTSGPGATTASGTATKERSA